MMGLGSIRWQLFLCHNSQMTCFFNSLLILFQLFCVFKCGFSLKKKTLLFLTAVSIILAQKKVKKKRFAFYSAVGEAETILSPVLNKISQDNF